ncbi:MAG: DUF86 domain-containing protein [Flavobacteriales bacterium]|nr:DUF86 domain-containing protein [Flavobacteriales bacterium]
MSVRLPKIILQDMVEAAQKILLYADGLSFEGFVSDGRTRDAVYHNLIVLGEAAGRMPEVYVHDHNDIPWQKMISTRNALVHGYDVIDDRIVWKIVTDILPGLLEQLNPLLEP